jgi:hypothetical protein
VDEDIVVEVLVEQKHDMLLVVVLQDIDLVLRLDDMHLVVAPQVHDDFIDLHQLHHRLHHHLLVEVFKNVPIEHLLLADILPKNELTIDLVLKHLVLVIVVVILTTVDLGQVDNRVIT